MFFLYSSHLIPFEKRMARKNSTTAAIFYLYVYKIKNEIEEEIEDIFMTRDNELLLKS